MAQFLGSTPNALDPTSRPIALFTFEDLTEMGLGSHEGVYTFHVSADPNDLLLFPQTTTNLSDWSFEPLQFLDATGMGTSSLQLRFRLKDTTDLRRFFRTGGTYGQ
jgi:hypothetical protein